MSVCAHSLRRHGFNSRPRGWSTWRTISLRGQLMDDCGRRTLRAVYREQSGVTSCPHIWQQLPVQAELCSSLMAWKQPQCCMFLSFWWCVWIGTDYDPCLNFGMQITVCCMIHDLWRRFDWRSSAFVCWRFRCLFCVCGGPLEWLIESLVVVSSCCWVSGQQVWMSSCWHGRRFHCHCRLRLVHLFDHNRRHDDHLRGHWRWAHEYSIQAEFLWIFN